MSKSERKSGTKFLPGDRVYFEAMYMEKICGFGVIIDIEDGHHYIKSDYDFNIGFIVASIEDFGDTIIHESVYNSPLYKALS